MSSVVEVRKTIQDILEDMTHIPSKRLPLDRGCWLMEWEEVQEKLQKALKLLDGLEKTAKTTLEIYQSVDDTPVGEALPFPLDTKWVRWEDDKP